MSTDPLTNLSPAPSPADIQAEAMQHLDAYLDALTRWATSLGLADTGALIVAYRKALTDLEAALHGGN